MNEHFADESEILDSTVLLLWTPSSLCVYGLKGCCGALVFVVINSEPGVLFTSRYRRNSSVGDKLKIE